MAQHLSASSPIKVNDECFGEYPPNNSVWCVFHSSNWQVINREKQSSAAST